VNDSGVNREGSSRVVIRCKERVIADRPLGDSLKYVRAVCASRWRNEWVSRGCREANILVRRLNHTSVCKL
jgi:hypothetical protein